MTEGDDQKAAAQGDQQHAAAVAAASSNAVDITPEKNGGIFKEIVKAGTGDETPSDGCSVSVHYTGKLVDGTEFDSSRSRGPFDFNLGSGAVIKAWEIGIKTMKKGEVAILTCAPEYAYGKSGSPPKIPADATLIFEVEVLDWKLEDISPDNDGSIQRRIITAGELYTNPKEEASVKVHLKGMYEGRVFDERDVEFVVGEGADQGVVKGVEDGLLKFKKGEKSLLRIAPNKAFGTTGNTQFSIPPNATVEYEVTLKSFENAKESWEMDIEEKLEQSEICKGKGTAFLKEEKYELALGKYRRVVSLLEHEDNLKEEPKDRRHALLLATQLNLALCYNKLNDSLEAIRACDKALELDPRSEKAFFRRGQAYIATKEFDLARKDFEEVLKIDSNNKAARNQLSICTVKLKQQLQKERQMYKHIFDRMAAQAETNAPASATKEPGKEEPLEPGVWNRSDENNQEAATPEESKTAMEADKEVPPESVPASS
ncbi:peptidyl-prolyl cis-trans isomerase FKBP4 [Dermacentor andersoni]|uniref:peptidyl-prolyl cis-trans isomerase FKBP4 n=1 Tax=Dermacentor andersoni TaxID=34620 RepID=UPI0021550720|nr:peptidyl-prolyl cis-trans isomerase FKBP4-like [Dermacentor andersoni]